MESDISPYMEAVSPMRVLLDSTCAIEQLFAWATSRESTMEIRYACNSTLNRWSPNCTTSRVAYTNAEMISSICKSLLYLQTPQDSPTLLFHLRFFYWLSFILRHSFPRTL